MIYDNLSEDDIFEKLKSSNPIIDKNGNVWID